MHRSDTLARWTTARRLGTRVTPGVTPAHSRSKGGPGALDDDADQRYGRVMNARTTKPPAKPGKTGTRTPTGKAAPARNAGQAGKARRPLPPALAENARSLHARAQARLKAVGEAAVERIKEKLINIGENVLDIGNELVLLTQPGVANALGHADFEAVCRDALGLHPTTARRWMAVATTLKRRFVLSIGVDRARALMELCDATPEQDSPEDLLDATLTLPSGKKLVVANATNEALDEAAKAYRHARDAGARGDPTKMPHGFTTSPAERKAHAAIEKRLAKAPADAFAATRLVAQRDGHGAKLILEVRLPAWDKVLGLLTR